MGNKNQVFIHNKDRYHLTCTAVEKIPAKDTLGRDITVNKKLFTVTFDSRTVDPMTGKIAATGYTAISQEQFDALSKGCWAFSKALKSGKIVKHAEAPKEALLDSQLINNLAQDNKAKDKRIAELEALLAEGKGKEGKPKAAKPKEAKPAKEDESEDMEF